MAMRIESPDYLDASMKMLPAPIAAVRNPPHACAIEVLGATRIAAAIKTAANVGAEITRRCIMLPIEKPRATSQPLYRGRLR
jgi:hypothetical protein